MTHKAYLDIVKGLEADGWQEKTELLQPGYMHTFVKEGFTTDKFIFSPNKTHRQDDI